MSKYSHKPIRLGLVLLLFLSLFACQKYFPVESQEEVSYQIIETGYYTNKEDVSIYLNNFHHLPDNYITKDVAETLGWDNDKGNLWDVSDKKSIGGDRFYNREGLLPTEDNITYYECDIDYEGGYRNAKRIVYGSDGSIYYTEDHYASFELLYEGE